MNDSKFTSTDHVLLTWLLCSVAVPTYTLNKLATAWLPVNSQHNQPHHCKNLVVQVNQGKMNSFPAPRIISQKSACMKVDTKWEKVEVKCKTKPSSGVATSLVFVSVVPGQTQTTSASHVALITLPGISIRELVWRKGFTKIQFTALYYEIFPNEKPRKLTIQ